MLSIVIPCYNEQSRLGRTLAETIRYGAMRSNMEIIVVSDGSKDATATVAQDIFRTLPPNITGHVIEYHPNRGKGEAVRTGMLAANGERILFMDADYAVPIESLETAEKLLDNGYDIAIGSRALDEAEKKKRQPLVREISAKVFGLIQRTYLGLRVKDSQCGFKLFTKEAAHRIFQDIRIASVIFDGEALWMARKFGFRVAEFPVVWTHDPDTRITYNLRASLGVLFDMIRIPWLHKNISR